MPTYLITSATGRQGTSTAKVLLASAPNVHINALVRDINAPAAQALLALDANLHLFETKDLDKAMAGVSGVFINPFPDFTDVEGEAKFAASIIAAARAAGTVKSMVVSTVYGANVPCDASEYPFLSQYFASKAAAERVVRESGFAYTIIRPAFLMHNFIGPGVQYQFPDFPSSRVLKVSFPRDFGMAILAAEDVGLVAGAALLDPAAFNGHELDLFSERLTFDEIAKQMGEAVGEAVKAEYRTPEESREAMVALPAVQSQLWHPANPGRENDEFIKLGLPLTSFREFVRKEMSAIRRTLGLE
ncbi:NmrA domain-containing protein [Mycena kentingensis (nom. inval.)]|nr:NmrA domain-containing protein [Mycena kentingensis (nom. inval.)]